jgi:hypothetical protein
MWLKNDKTLIQHYDKTTDADLVMAVIEWLV